MKKETLVLILRWRPAALCADPARFGTRMWSAAPVVMEPRRRSFLGHFETHTHRETASSAAAKRALSRKDDVPLMGAIGARVLLRSIHRGAEEVCTRVDTRLVDVEVLGEVAHLARLRQPAVMSVLCSRSVCWSNVLCQGKTYMDQLPQWCKARRT